MSSIWTVAFWKASAERAIKTGAQTFGALLTAYGVSVGLDDIDWAATGSTTAVAVLLSLVTSVGSGLITDGSPSLTDVEKLVPEPDVAP